MANACRCVFSVRCDVGNLKSLNEVAKQARADHIIHTGDFGFYDDTSLDRIADKLALSPAPPRLPFPTLGLAPTRRSPPKLTS